MVDEKSIMEKANDIGLTFAKNFNGKPYALMDADWIGYFNTINAVCDYLGIDYLGIYDEAESEDKE